MPYQRQIYLGDTDAAGVIYFSRLLSICHEAYEDSLQKAQIELNIFLKRGAIAIPIVHAEIDYLRPLFCGDTISIQLKGQQTSDFSFKIDYQIEQKAETVSTAMTKHVAINPETRRKTPLPSMIREWLDCQEA